MTSRCSIVRGGAGPYFGSPQQTAGLSKTPWPENGPVIEAVKICLT